MEFIKGSSIILDYFEMGKGKSNESNKSNKSNKPKSNDDNQSKPSYKPLSERVIKPYIERGESNVKYTYSDNDCKHIIPGTSSETHGQSYTTSFTQQGQENLNKTQNSNEPYIITF